MSLDIYFNQSTNKQIRLVSNLNMVNIAKFPPLVTACMSFDVLVWFFSFPQIES